MVRFLSFFVLCGLPMLSLAEDRLPTPNYQKQPSDPAWLAQVVQVHGHLGPSAVVGARMGMIALLAVDAKGYFDVEVTCAGPLAKPPQSCFLDGIQAATGATMGKRSLYWAQADRLVVQIKNTKTGKMAEVRPAAASRNYLPNSIRSRNRRQRKATTKRRMSIWRHSPEKLPRWSKRKLPK